MHPSYWDAKDRCNTLSVAKIGVLEDDSLMRLALSESLRAAGHEVVFDAGDASSFVNLARGRHIEVALLDVHLGESVTGLDVAFKLRTIYPDLALIFITSFSDPRLIPGGHKQLPERSIYLEKARIDSIRSLQNSIDEALVGARATTNSGQALSNLTDSQIEVLRLVAQGLSNAQIAEATKTTVKNVEGIISRIIKSLGLQESANQNQRVHMARVYFRSRGVRLDD